jgi:tetratricopeptide (TPR) repeat protein
MEDSTLAMWIGLMAGAIFFIDGWGPSEKILDENGKEKQTSFFESRRFRGLSVLIAGGIITPVLDYVTQNEKHEFVLSYLKGCVWGWFFVFLFGLLVYLFWKIANERKEKSFWFKAGEFAYSVLDFIYLGIADNPHLKAKRDSDVSVAEGRYKLKGDYKLKEIQNELARELEKESVTPDNIDEPTKKKLEEYEKQLKSIKTEANYTFEDWYYKGLAEYDKGEYEKTIAYMKNALEKDPKSNLVPDAYIYIGLAYDYIGLYKKGIEYYDKIITDHKNYSYLYLAYNNKAADLIDLGYPNESLPMLDQAIRLKSDLNLAWNYKGIVFTRTKNYDEALKSLDEALKID